MNRYIATVQVPILANTDEEAKQIVLLLGLQSSDHQVSLLPVHSPYSRSPGRPGVRGCRAREGSHGRCEPGAQAGQAGRASAYPVPVKL